MTVRLDKLGGTDWTTGETPLASADLNDTIAAAYMKPAVVYTSTDLDLAATGSASTTFSISTDDLKSHVLINPKFFFTASALDGKEVYFKMKIETAEVGSTTFTQQFYNYIDYLMVGSASQTDIKRVLDFAYYYAPTAGELTNGLQVKITTEMYVDTGTGGGCSNIQTIIWVN